MKLKTMIYNFYNNFGEDPDNEEDDEDFDEDDDEDEEDNEEGEDDEEDESGFGEDIGDGYGEDAVDPLDAQERAEAGEDQQEKSSGKEKKQTNDQAVKQKVAFKRKPGKKFNAKVAAAIAKKHPFSMTRHVEARCHFCHKKSIVRCKKNYIRISCASMRILAHKQFTPFYCVNPKCKMSFQRDYIQMAGGISYEGNVIPIREILKVSKT